MMARPDLSRLLRAVLLLALLCGLVGPGALAAEASAADAPSPVRIAGVTPRSTVDDEVWGQGSTGRSATARAGVTGAAIGQRALLVLRVYYDGEKWPAVGDPSMDQYSVSEVQKRLTTAATSSRAMLFAQSGGQLSITGMNGADADVSDWLTFPGTLPRDGNGQCNADAIRIQALAAATTAGLTPNLYDHVMIIFPLVSPLRDCPWAGLGQVGGHITWINGFYGSPGQDLVDSGVAAHELGHNLGVSHASSLACTQTSADPATAILPSTTCQLPTSATNTSTTGVPTMEYGDPFDMMGTFGYGFPWRGTELMSTWHRAQLLELPEPQQQVVSTAGTYVLHAAGAADGLQLLRIARGTGAPATAELALEYRPAGTGFDRWDLDPVSWPPSGGVLVRLVPSLTTAAFSYLLDGTPETGQHYVGPSNDDTFRIAFRAAWRDAGLQVGRTLIDQQSGVSVTVTAATADTATVHLTGGALSPVTPTPTPAPTSAPTPAPTPTPAVSPTPTPTTAPGVVSTTPTLAAPQLLFPAARQGTARLTRTRRIVVSFPGAGRVTAAIGSSWFSARSSSTATFRLPRSAVSRTTVRLRATQGSLGVPVVATLRVRRGVLTFTAG